MRFQDVLEDLLQGKTIFRSSCPGLVFNTAEGSIRELDRESSICLDDQVSFGWYYLAAEDWEILE